jgi:hypothetical protein
MLEVHFHGDSEYDTSLCGRDVLGGGEFDISKVTCSDCLKTLVAYGLAARDRMAELSQCEEKKQCECH